MTDQQAAAQVAEAATPVEMKSRAVPSGLPTETETPKPEPTQEAAVTEEVEAIEKGGHEAEQTEETATSDGDDATAKPKNKGVGKRINELTREKHDAIRERDYWREQAMRTQQGSAPAQQEAPQAQAAEQDAGEPRLEDFDFDPAAFNRAHYQWMREQERQQESTQARLTTLRERETAFEAEHPDYREVVFAPHVPITQDMAQAMLGTDNPPAIAYHLAQNLDEAAAIAKLPPIQQAIAIGRIEAQLSATASAPPPPTPPKKTTNAPPPPKTVAGAGQPQVSVDDPNISTAQRIALWKKESGRGSR